MMIHRITGARLILIGLAIGIVAASSFHERAAEIKSKLADNDLESQKLVIKLRDEMKPIDRTLYNLVAATRREMSNETHFPINEFMKHRRDSINATMEVVDLLSTIPESQKPEVINEFSESQNLNEISRKTLTQYLDELVQKKLKCDKRRTEIILSTEHNVKLNTLAEEAKDLYTELSKMYMYVKGEPIEAVVEGYPCEATYVGADKCETVDYGHRVYNKKKYSYEKYGFVTIYIKREDLPMGPIFGPRHGFEEGKYKVHFSRIMKKIKTQKKSKKNTEKKSKKNTENKPKKKKRGIFGCCFKRNHD